MLWPLVAGSMNIFESDLCFESKIFLSGNFRRIWFDRVKNFPNFETNFINTYFWKWSYRRYNWAGETSLKETVFATWICNFRRSLAMISSSHVVKSIRSRNNAIHTVICNITFFWNQFSICINYIINIVWKDLSNLP